jgi:hypothetical protein
MVDAFDYSHGAQGSKPATPLDFQADDAIPPEHFDWWWYRTIQLVNNIAAILEEIDSDEDGVVDAADSAAVAATADTVAGNDVSGQVAEAAVAVEARGIETRTSDPSSPSDGQLWIRTDL